MKKLVKTSRTVQMLETVFRMLNEDFFDGQVPTPIITLVPSAKSYAHYTLSKCWIAGDEGKHEINISSAWLNRPLEDVIASLMHEICHAYANEVLNVQDVSRHGVWHNKIFARIALEHGLDVAKDESIGHRTSCGYTLFKWIVEHIDALREIEICRVSPDCNMYGIGNTTNYGITGTTGTTNGNSHSIKYSCPKCKNSVRATKTVNIICVDCMVIMQA